MAVYYKFKSARDYNSVFIETHFISLGLLKQRIFELKHMERGTDYDLIVTNANTNEEYLDEGILIPKNTSVIVRRVPGLPRPTVVVAPVSEQQGQTVEHNSHTAIKGSSSGTGVSDVTTTAEVDDWDEFGDDPYAIPKTVTLQSSTEVTPCLSKEDEDRKIKALVNTPALDFQPSDIYGPGGFKQNLSRKVMSGRGFGRSGFANKTPPQGYICRRCKVPGHFIQHCPTNDDPTYDLKRVKPTTGIPRSMLIASQDGSYKLPSGDIAVLKPNEDAFDKEMEGMPSRRSVVDLPPELHCPLCKQGMKDAVFASKCCFSSYCDKCIRDHIISKSRCVCGASNILADDLLPNKTLRDTINRIMESNSCSSGSSGVTFQAPVSDMESRDSKVIPLPSKSASSRELQSPKREGTSIDEDNKATTSVVLKQEKPRTPEGSECVIEEPLDKSSQLAEPVQKKTKKRKETHGPSSAAATEMNRRSAQVEYQPQDPYAYNPYWNGVQPGFNAFMPSSYSGYMPYMNYGYGVPQDPFIPQGAGPATMQKSSSINENYHHRSKRRSSDTASTRHLSDGQRLC